MAANKLLIRLYKPHKIYWLIRCNVVVMRDIRTLEITLGLLGRGFLLNWRYGADRVKKQIDEMLVREAALEASGAKIEADD